MPRVRLKPLSRYRFSTEITVRTTDLNYGGHLGNDRLLSLIQEARVAFLAEHGLAEIMDDGTMFILGDAAVVYQGEAFAGDTLSIEVAAGEPSRCGFRFFYRVTRPADGAPIALVENGVVCLDHRTKEIRPLPETIRAACTEER
jgi:acyl-CoA thioesterase FadM